jgi:hypothetical protein
LPSAEELALIVMVMALYALAGLGAFLWALGLSLGAIKLHQ